MIVDGNGKPVGVWRSRLIFTAAVLIITGVIVVLMFVTFENIENDREEWKADCRDAGGRVVELGRDLSCIVGREEMEYEK